MRVPLVYPKIPGSKNSPFKRCIAFEKYDGTNLHWVWEPSRGWSHFGTRRDRFTLDWDGIKRFGEAHSGLEEAPSIFKDTMADLLAERFKQHERYKDTTVIIFTEYLGSNSFAGMHRAHDPKQLVLIDVCIGSTMLNAEEFITDFNDCNMARVVYKGKLTGKFIQEIRDNKYGVNEGVVCKGRGADGNVWMVKIKTNAYKQKLIEAFGDRWKSYWE